MIEKGKATHQALVARALERFHAELGDDDMDFVDVGGPEELLAEARSLEQPFRGQRTASGTILRLESTLSQISDFAAFIALSSGVGTQVTGIIWGSLKIIFVLLRRTTDTFEDVLNMLDELGLALPRFKSYADTLQLTPELETCLVDVYTEMICFCARLIKFFRGSPHHFLVREGWPYLNGDFKQTLNRLKMLSHNVDREANAIRLRGGRQNNAELVEAIDSLKLQDNKHDRIPCHCVPSRAGKAFFGRQQDIGELQDCLLQEKLGLRCVLLHGLGGIGKSTLALHFASMSGSFYDAILWIPADDRMKVQQAFLTFAQRVGIIAASDDANEASLAMTKVKEWLKESGYRWLMILDNIEDVDTLDYVWPGGGHGSILITSRDGTVCFGRSATTIHLKPFDPQTGKSALLELSKHQTVSVDEDRIATELVDVLGGLPLAINHVSGFMVQQQMSLIDFGRVYTKNAAKINARTLSHGEQTLATVWAIALAKLSFDSARLQGLLAFLDPDCVHEQIFLDAHEEDHSFKDFLPFLEDEMSLLDAKSPLLKNALIERDPQEASLSMHRLVQAAVIRRLEEDEKTLLFDATVQLLGSGFPNTWNTVTGHQRATWEQCGMRAAHVESLIQKHKAFKIQSQRIHDFVELIFRIAWYLYERELYDQAETLLNKGLSILGEHDSLTYAAACTLRGLIELDTSRLHDALDSFLEGLKIRERLLKPTDEFIASSFNAISLAYTELNQLDKAKQYGDNATRIREGNNSERTGNSYCNMSSTLLRMSRADEAEVMLRRYPTLHEFSDEAFLQSGNPREVGNMVLLSRIRLAQGHQDEAMRLACKALTFRQSVHGDRLKTCDSLQSVGAMLEAREDRESAILMFEQCNTIASRLPYGESFVARANYGLARLYAAAGDMRQSEKCRQSALDARKRMARKECDAFTEAECEMPGYLIPWILW